MDGYYGYYRDVVRVVHYEHRAVLIFEAALSVKNECLGDVIGLAACSWS